MNYLYTIENPDVPAIKAEFEAAFGRDRTKRSGGRVEFLLQMLPTDFHPVGKDEEAILFRHGATKAQREEIYPKHGRIREVIVEWAATAGSFLAGDALEHVYKTMPLGPQQDTAKAAYEQHRKKENTVNRALIELARLGTLVRNGRLYAISNKPAPTAFSMLGQVEKNLRQIVKNGGKVGRNGVDNSLVITDGATEIRVPFPVEKQKEWAKQ